MLLEPAVVDADEAGKVYVLDRKAGQIKVFDPQGNFLRAIGRRGQGPGEFQEPRYFRLHLRIISWLPTLGRAG